jgi:hypothetical protein
MILVMVGCASKTNIEANLDDGKSIIIFPKYDTDALIMHWGKVGSNATYSFSRNHEASMMGNYIIIPIDAGIYYIKNVSVKMVGGLHPTYVEEHNSTWGDIVLEKTPEEMRTDKMDLKQKGRITKEVWESIVSYYKFDYSFSEDSSLGTITINPNEIVMMPTVLVDVILKENSCKHYDNQEDGLLYKFARNHRSPFDLLFSVGGSNGIYTWYWSCPVKEFIVNISSTSLDDFIDFAKTHKVIEKVARNYASAWLPRAHRALPKDLLEKIVVRDFKFRPYKKVLQDMEFYRNITTKRYRIEKLE